MGFLIPAFIALLIAAVGLVGGVPLVIVNSISQVGLYMLFGSFVVGLLFFLLRYYLWYRTVYVVTSKRIILLVQEGLFTQDDREASLSMIQDVRAQVKGLQQTLYGFGDVVVQVSSEDSQLSFLKIPDPKGVQQIIIREAHLKD